MADNEDLDKLMIVAPHAKHHVLLCSDAVCTDNFQTFTTVWSTNDQTPWLIDCYCATCQMQWSFCSECANVKTILTSENQIKQHKYTYHNPKRPNKRKKNEELPKDIRNTIAAIPDTNNRHFRHNTYDEECANMYTSDDSFNLENHTVSGNTESVTTDVLTTLTATGEQQTLNTNTMRFYSYDLKTCGKKYLVANMCGNLSSNFGKLSAAEVDYQIKMSRFVSSLTVKQQTQFAFLLDDLGKVYLAEGTESIIPLCRIPKRLSDLRRMYTEGENSIDNHLPIPACKMINEHSYVSIIECIADMLLHNTECIANVEGFESELHRNKIPDDGNLLFRSKRIKDILEKGRHRVTDNTLDNSIVVLPIFVSLWSDDFDPNRSIKANRQSVWIKTCTLFFMNDKGEKRESTYPIALSTKGCQHEDVECKIKQEIELLSSGILLRMYSRYHEGPVYVHGEIYCIMNDQPERRGNLKLANGNAICHGRFGLILDCKQKKDKIKSCLRCSESIQCEVEDFMRGDWSADTIYDWRRRRCFDCSAWMHHGYSTLLKFKPDKDYPAHMSNDDGTIDPFFILRKDLEDTITMIHETIQQGTIRTAEAKSILKYSGFSTEAQDKILSCASNCKNLLSATRNKDDDPHTFGAMLEDSQEDPNIYEKYVLSSAWYNFQNLNCHVDVPMHLLMLGVVKSVLLKIGVWLRYRSQKTAFLTLAGNILGNVKDLNVQWCKILHYPTTDKFGGWVSENFLAMSRLATWFYSLIEYLPEADPYVDPTTPYNKWTKTLNANWLEARGLSKVGTAADLRNRVAKLFDANDIPTVIIKNECKKEHILDLVKHLSLMIHLIMSYNLQHNDVDILEAAIRLFLIKYDIVDNGITEKETPSWITQYNFLCLLNLPATIRLYGNVRNLWEGGSNGEGYLKRVKSELKPGLVNQWQKWSLSNLLQDKLYDQWMTDKHATQDPTIVNLKNECRLYGKRCKALEALESGKPFSGIMLIDQHDNVTYYVCYRAAGKIKKMRILISRNTTIHNGILYHHIKNTKEYTDFGVVNHPIGAIFLPVLENKGDEIDLDNRLYYIVRSDWT
jgi:hypothetical protein